MQSPQSPFHAVRMRRLHLIVSVLAISLVAMATLIVPRVIQTAHAAPKPANTCAQPPAGKDPTTFTPQQLKQYGLPPQLPGQSQAQWAELLRHAKHRTCSSHPVTSATRGHTKTASGHFSGSGRYATPHKFPAAPTRFADTVCSQCITGAMAYIPQQGSFGYDFIYDIGNWNVPCVSSPEDGSAFSQWVSIGYFANETQIQAGVQVTTQDETIILPPFRTLTFAVPVYTAYVTDGNQVQSFSVNCGDHIGALEDLWNGYVFVMDISTNNYAELLLGTTFIPSPYAGCYVDDPNGGVQDLMNFGTTTFTRCTLTDEGEGTVLFSHGVGAWISSDGGGPVGAIQSGNGPMADVVQPLPDNFNDMGQFSVQWSAAN